MESKVYEKMGKVILVGFIIFSMLVIWLVNVYFSEENKYRQREVDTIMSKAILQDTYHTNKILEDMEKNLIIQKDLLQEIVSEQNMKLSNTSLLPIVYLPQENVSILDESRIASSEKIGNIIIKGNWNELDGSVKAEINQMTLLFQIQSILNKSDNTLMNSAYYSKDGYVLFHPYIELGKRDMNYNMIFSSIDDLFNKVQELDKNDDNFNIEIGWDQATIDSSKKVTLSTAMPILVNDEIVGILTGSISQDRYTELLQKDLENIDAFIVDASNSIIYSSNKDFENLENIDHVFKENYGIKYYQNKFPTQLEVRREKEYTLFITQLAKENWYIIYAVDNLKTLNSIRIFALNLIMVVMVFGISYYAIRFDSLNRINIESIVRHAQNDSMTELLNHKYILDTLKRFLKYRRIRQMAVMMLDIDDFKVINDSYGHGVGDQVISICANVLKGEMISNNCIAGRYGGEEFLFIAVRMSKEDVFELAERIRVKVNEMVYEKMGFNITISIGVYHIVKPTPLSVIELVNEADQYLYEAKRAGKNQVQGGSNI